MDKKIILLGILVLVVYIGMTGCISPTTDEGEDTDGDSYPDNNDEFPNDPNEWIDSDKDGIGDNADDFPTDATLHEIYYIHDSLGTEKKDDPWILSPSENKEFTWSISEEWKFVFINQRTVDLSC